VSRRLEVPLVLELFAGAGGATEGIGHALPGAFHLAVEKDEGAAAVWTARHGANGRCLVRSTADPLLLREVTRYDRDFDLLWASPPCQRHSRAGKGEGYDGWPDVQRAVAQLRPPFVVIENVVGAPAEEWADWLRSREYSATVWLLDAADYGVPQHRRRQFVVASKVSFVGNMRPPHPSHGPRGRQPWVTMRQALGLPGGVLVEGGGGNPGRGRGAASTVRRERDLTDEPSTTIAARPGGNSLPYVKPAWWHRDGDPDAPSRTISTRGNNQISWARDASGEIVYPGGLGRAGTEPERLDQPAPTVTTTEVKGTRASKASKWTFNGGPDRASDAAFLATGRRRLTPSECATLQGFPEHYPWGSAAAVHRYRYIGNAVPPRLAEVVVRRLLEG